MSYLVPLLILLAALGASVGYGLWWLRVLRYEPGHRPLELLHAVALGLGTLGYFVLALGLGGLLQRGALLTAVGVGWVLLVPALIPWLRGRHLQDPAAKPLQPEEGPRAERYLTLALAVYLGLLVLLTLPSAFRPPDGLDWDSLSYHLAAPKIYLREGRIPFIAYDSHTHFPFTMEMLYTLGLAFGGTAGAKLFHWAAGWLTAAAVGFWTDRLEFRGRRVPQWSGPLAAALFASMPLVLWEMGTAYVDLGTALFQFLALAALLDAVRWEDGRPVVRAEGAAVAGVLTGFALGTKMTALIQWGLLGLGLLWVVARSAPEARRGAVLSTLLYGTLGLLVGSPWYLKSWLWVGNPVYPFFYSFFPGSYSWNAALAAGYQGEQNSFGLGRRPENAARVLWDFSVHGRAFYIALKSVTGDKLGSLGPAWAGLVPLALWTRGLGWKAWSCIAYAAGSLLFWFFMTQQTRYLVPVFAPLAVAAAVVPSLLPTGLLRAASGVFLALTLVLNVEMHRPIATPSIQLLTGELKEEELLTASLGGIYEAAQFVNSLPETSRVALYQDTRAFYFDRRYFWANPGQHDHIPYEDLANGDDLAAHLRRFGITHVLINFSLVDPLTRTGKWYRLLMDGVQRGTFEEAWRSSRAAFDQRGVIIYKLR